MRILMASTSYPRDLTDWRGRFIYNLAAALARQPALELRLWAPPGVLPASVIPAATEAESIWLDDLARLGGIAHLLRQGPLQGLRWGAGLLWRLRQAYRREHDCDVVHANWLQTALPLWGTRKPLVVSVLGSDLGLLRLPGITAALRHVFRARKTIIAPNAEWMVLPLRKLFGDVAEIRSIVFGVDQIWFDIKRTPAEHGLWLAVTRLTRKKIGTLFEWGDGLFGEQRQLHLFGPMQESLELPSWVIYHGPTHPSELAQDWFTRATGLVSLSQHDEGRPQIMIEAMAAGLPIIASDLPGHRDIVQHKQTGWIASTQISFKEGLLSLEQSAQNKILGDAARHAVKHTIGTWDDCATHYVSLYRSLLGHAA